MYTEWSEIIIKCLFIAGQRPCGQYILYFDIRRLNDILVRGKKQANYTTMRCYLSNVERNQ
jgi:hypothetical protein